MKVTIARLRSNVKYNGPLQTVLDSFFENYLKWQRSRKDLEYDVYNVSFTNQRPVRNIDAIKEADVIVIPSDSEFRYHGELQINPKDLAKSEEHISAIRPYFENKTVIMFRSDRADTEDLYRNETLQGVNLKSFNVIYEIYFSVNIHGMKYHFIQELKTKQLSLFETEKNIDFGYWGKMKHGNDRAKTIRTIYRDKDITKVLVGGFPSGVERKSAWIKDWNILYPLLEPARTTLCFNWLDPNATTSRYPEALSIGIIPFVWRDYDFNNSYKIDDWQRVSEWEELKERMIQLRDDNLFSKKLEEYRNNYKQVLLSEDQYSEQFSKMMNTFILNG